MKNLFNSIKLTRPQNNVFDLSHDVKLAMNMGELIPMCCMEAVPGDKFNLSCESLLRFAPLVSPVMHRMDVTMHYFFVPNRILWDNWENFITQTKVGVTPAVPAFPTCEIDIGNYPDVTKLPSYFGIPLPHDAQSEVVNVLPFAAYQAIYNEYYRDQNLIEEVDYKVIDGDNTTNFNAILSTKRIRAWEHDYFTASLPFAQKGDAVDIPLGKVVLDPDSVGTSAGVFADATNYASHPAGGVDNSGGGAVVGIIPVVYDPVGTLETEATTINDLRRAFKLQEWLERNARGGTRYIENILAHFGVKSSDKRLQRPEYITGTKSPVVISEVLNTSDTTSAPQGNMAGHAVSVTSGKYGRYYCEEHGYIIGIMSVMPKTAYQDGIPKHFLKISDAFQYYWPTFAHLGEQEVLSKELYAYQGAPGNDTFGYVPRYAEYKYMPSRVAGEFQSSLAFWHLGRIFTARQELNQDFIECVPRSDIFAVTGAQDSHLYAHVLNKVSAVRPMPKFGTPHM